MNRRYEALEVCLNKIEQGADVDTALSRYPESTAELRPILEIAIDAKGMAVPPPSKDVVVRNRVKLLDHATELREGKSEPKSWFVPLRRALISLTVIAFLIISGTNLVRAASTTLPGDGLYPIKRAWEDVRLFFAFNMEERDALILEYASERLDEVHELLTLGRSVHADFSGQVSRQNGDEWLVSGIKVFISSETLLPKLSVEIGATVRVQGLIQSGAGITAEQIELLSQSPRLPAAENNEKLEQPDMDETDIGSGIEATVVPTLPTSTPLIEFEYESIEGVVVAIAANFIVVDDVLMNIQFAEVKGVPQVGVTAKAEGYFDVDGIFIVAEIEFGEKGSSSGGGITNENNNNNNEVLNSNNDNDDNSNSNSNDNEPDDD